MTALRNIIAASWAGSFDKPLALDPFGRTDPGMRLVSEREKLMAAGLPIDSEGNAIPENLDD